MSELSPRQRMINMMYLVLTALLALNVSKEVLEALQRWTTRLNMHMVTSIFQTRNIIWTSRIGQKKIQKKFQEWYSHALSVKRESKEILDQVKVLKLRLNF